jgi:ribosome assembly protein SQT1
MSGFSSAPANEGPANQPELLEEVELDEGDALSDNDDMSTIMGDDDDENIEKQMMNENGQGQGKEGAMDAIGEEDDMANVVFRGHSDAVYCGVIHPTVPGLVLTGGGDDNAFLWRFPITSNLIDSSEQVDIETVIPLEGHTDTVTSVGFNFDGTMALTGSYDGTVRIWKADTGEFLRTLEGPEDVEWASWHSKGNAVIAGSKDGTLWMWLAHNGQCMQVFAGHEGAVACGMFSADGKVICTGGEDGTLRVWAPKTGACKHVFDNIHEGLVTSISVSTKDPDLVMTGKLIFLLLSFLALPPRRRRDKKAKDDKQFTNHMLDYRILSVDNHFLKSDAPVRLSSWSSFAFALRLMPP